MVKYLIQKGADVEAKDDEYGSTALIKATIWRELEVVKCLVEHGADVNQKDKEGKTALDIARKCGKADYVMILEEANKKNLAQKGQSAKMNVSQIAKADEGR